MKDIYKNTDTNIDNLIETLQNNRHTIVQGVADSSRVIVEAIKEGRKILICGNGGSAAQSQHIAAEFIVRLRSEFTRGAYPAIALTTDTSIITASLNDFGIDEIFSRQIDALGKRGDILIAISTSGNSTNICVAIEKAKMKKMTVIGLLGKDGGKAKSIVNIPIVIKSESTLRIQEIHMNIGHTIVENVENILNEL